MPFVCCQRLINNTNTLLYLSIDPEGRGYWPPLKI